MLSADCQKSRGKGKTLGLHSAVFPELGDGSTRLNYENDGKITENCSQLRKLGYPLPWAGLSRVRNWQANTGVIPPEERQPPAREADQRALTHHPKLPWHHAP